MTIQKTFVFSFIILLAVTAFSVRIDAQAKPAAPATTATAVPTPSAEEKQKAKEELEKKALVLLDKTVSEAALLKFPENRAYVYSTAAELLWNFDQKRARTLFRSAVDDIANAQLQAERRAMETENMYPASSQSDIERIRILSVLARYDARMAQDLMMQTRSARIVEAIDKYKLRKEMGAAAAPAPPAPPAFAKGPSSSDMALADMELRTEEGISQLVALQDPEKAVKIIQEAMAKSVTGQVWSMIQKLYKKDAEKGKSLAAEMTQKLFDQDLTKSSDGRSLILSILNTATASSAVVRKDSLSFEESQLRDMAVKLADAYLALDPAALPSNSNIDIEMSRSLKVIEKLAPDRLASLKQKQSEIRKTIPPSVKGGDSTYLSVESNISVQEVLEAAQKLPAERQVPYYEAAIQRLARMENEAEAKSLADQFPNENLRGRALQAIESGRINRLAAEGRLDEALKMIDALSGKRNKMNKLISVAQTLNRKNTDADRQSAIKLMNQARGLISEDPDNMQDMTDLAQVIQGYTGLDNAQAFRLVLPLIRDIDDQIRASVMLSKFSGDYRMAKNDETLMVGGSGMGALVLNRLRTNFRALARADIDKTAALADRLQRLDSKLMVRLFILQSTMIE